MTSAVAFKRDDQPGRNWMIGTSATLAASAASVPNLAWFVDKLAINIE
jgi:hypothetical protein